MIEWSISQPTTDHLNKILGGVELWTRHLGYGLDYTERDPSVSMSDTGLAAMAKYDMYPGTFRIYVDVDDNWNWNIRAITTGQKQDLKVRFDIHSQDLQVVANEIKEKILKHLDRSSTVPITFENNYFTKNLFKSLVVLVEEEYNVHFR